MEKPTSNPERITMKTIWYGVLDIFNLERGLGFTLIALTTKPGHAIREYLEEDRRRLVPPFRFLVFTVAIATFLTMQYFKGRDLFKDFESGFSEGYSKSETSDETVMFLETYQGYITNIFSNYFNVILLLGVPILALMTFWFFRKNMNFAEHLVINSYLTGYITLIYIVLMPILWLTDYLILSVVYAVLSLIYSGFLYVQLFQERIGRGIVKTLVVNLLYYTIYYIMIILFFLILAIILIPK